MTPAQRRFGGVSRLYGVQGARRIQRAHVAVVGIGGVGSWAAESLARSGVGRLTLIDLDHVAESNFNRQIHACEATLGMAKTLAMQARIATYAPDCEVQAVDDFLAPANCEALLGVGVDAVVDACDQVAAKVAIAAWGRRAGVAVVCVGAAGGKRQPHEVRMADLGAVTHDPLLAKVRYGLRRHHGAPAAGAALGVMCVYSTEPVKGAADCDAGGQSAGHLNCHGYGSSVAVTATFGQCAAAWVLNGLADAPG